MQFVDVAASIYIPLRIPENNYYIILFNIRLYWHIPEDISFFFIFLFFLYQRDFLSWINIWGNLPLNIGRKFVFDFSTLFQWLNCTFRHIFLLIQKSTMGISDSSTFLIFIDYRCFIQKRGRFSAETYSRVWKNSDNLFIAIFLYDVVAV